jgi:uncharacterized membrane protein
MKMKYKLTFALCVTALFLVGVAFGAINLTNNTTDLNKTNENKTNTTEIANETGDAVMPVNTTVEPAAPEETTIEPATPDETTIEPATPDETTIEPTVPAATKPSPGFGIVVTIMVVLSAIYIGKRRR